MGSVTVKCDKCGTSNTVQRTAFDFEETGGDPEREMGAEVFYEGTYEYECAGCKSHIAIKHEFSEYPIGAENWSETTAEGGTVVKNSL
jgi:hypothetical protein